MKERIKMEKIIKLENVSLAKQGQTILKNLNWQVNKGEHWAILGLNGSGKSTLLRLLMAENWKTQGKVTVLSLIHICQQGFHNLALPYLALHHFVDRLYFHKYHKLLE